MKAPDSDEYKKDQSKNDLETNDINTYTESVSMTIPSSDERKRKKETPLLLQTNVNEWTQLYANI